MIGAQDLSGKSNAIGYMSSTAEIGPDDYQHLYRNVQHAKQKSGNQENMLLADFVIEYVSDFINRQDKKYNRWLFCN